MGMDFSFEDRRRQDRIERLMDRFNNCPVEIRARLMQFVELVSIALIVSSDEEAVAMMGMMDVEDPQPDQLQRIQEKAMSVLRRYKDEIVATLEKPMPHPLPPRPEGDDDRSRPCKFCGSYHLTAVEYRGTSEDYDGTSEWDCSDCGKREGRWTHRELAEGELEPRYGLPLRNRN